MKLLKNPFLTMLKKVLDLSLNLDPHKSLVGSILDFGGNLVEIGSVVLVSSCRQTNQPTNGHGWKHTLLGVGNKALCQ